MSEVVEITERALEEVAVFPLSGAVLLPRTLISLHVFEPRYRAMTQYCLDGSRLMVVAMTRPESPPDAFGRPAVHKVAGLGILRQSARLPDGRYNIVIEGLCRVNISDEHDPGPSFRRVRARILEDQMPADSRSLLPAMASLRSLCTRAMVHVSPSDASELQGLNEVDEPGPLADLVAAAALTDPSERQDVLAEPDVEARLGLVAGSLGAFLLVQQSDAEEDSPIGWGITPGKA
ncbi:MAG: LON peptidase substrate-binding domain-containing protein [Myxococcota bacterium]